MDDLVSFAMFGKACRYAEKLTRELILRGRSLPDRAVVGASPTNEAKTSDEVTRGRGRLCL